MSFPDARFLAVRAIHPRYAIAQDTRAGQVLDTLLRARLRLGPR